VSFQIYRWSFSNKEQEWYISIIEEGKCPGEKSDIDFFSTSARGGAADTPHGYIWSKHDPNGLNPLPTVEWKRSDDGYFFGHHSFETDHLQNIGFGPSLRSGQKKGDRIPDDIACTLKLWNGETMYPGSQRSVLKSMLSHAKKAASSECSTSDTHTSVTKTKISGEPETLVDARRKNPDYDRSDLERICQELANEAGL